MDAMPILPWQEYSPNRLAGQPTVTSGRCPTLLEQRKPHLTPYKRATAFRQPQAVYLDDDMIDWFLADPLAAAEFLRTNRVQMLDDGGQAEPVRVMVLTRDSVPGLGLAC